MADTTTIVPKKSTFIPAIDSSEVIEGLIKGEVKILPEQQRNWMRDALTNAALTAGLINFNTRTTVNGTAMYCKIRILKRLDGGNEFAVFGNDISWSDVVALDIVNDMDTPIPYGTFTYAAPADMPSPFSDEVKMGNLYLYVNLSSGNASDGLGVFQHLFKIISISPTDKSGDSMNLHLNLQSYIADIMNDNANFGFSYAKPGTETKDPDTQDYTTIEEDTTFEIIAGKLLNDNTRYADIAELNPGIEEPIAAGTKIKIPLGATGALLDMQKDIVGKTIYDLFFFPKNQADVKTTGYVVNSQMYGWSKSTYPFFSICSSLSKNNFEFFNDVLLRYTLNILFFSFYNDDPGLDGAAGAFDRYNVLSISSLTSLGSRMMQSLPKAYNYLYWQNSNSLPTVEAQLVKDCEYLADLTIDELNTLARPVLLVDTTFTTMKDNGNYKSYTWMSNLAKKNQRPLSSVYDKYDGMENWIIRQQFFKLSAIQFNVSGNFCRDIGQVVFIENKPDDRRFDKVTNSNLLIYKIRHYMTRENYFQQIWATNGGNTTDIEGSTTEAVTTTTGTTGV